MLWVHETAPIPLGFRNQFTLGLSLGSFRTTCMLLTNDAIKDLLSDYFFDQRFEAMHHIAIQLECYIRLRYNLSSLFFVNR